MNTEENIDLNNIKNMHKSKHTLKHLLKFVLLLCVFFAYFIFISTKYGAEKGLLVAALSWSFFVLCTPLADAGFLVDFPVRLITKIKMFVVEIFVWVVAISLNIYALLFNSDVYNSTELLKLFHKILTHPIPFYSIIFMSMLGTFVSIKFGDDIMDKTTHVEKDNHHKENSKKKLIIMAVIFAITFILYYFLLKELGVKI